MFLPYYIAKRDHGGHISMIDIDACTTLLEVHERLCQRDPKLRQYHRFWLTVPRDSFDKQVQWSEKELQRQNIQYCDETMPLLELSLEELYGDEDTRICLIFIPDRI